MHRVFHVAVFLLGTVATLSAKPQNHELSNAESTTPRVKAKLAWEWQDVDRIAARTNSQLARERLARHASAIGSGIVASQSTLESGVVDVIAGQEHPELLLSSELFEQLLVTAYNDQLDVSQTTRDSYRQVLSAVGLPSDFWSRLEPIVADAVTALQKRRLVRAGASRVDSQNAYRVARREACRATAAALRQARTSFGSSRLDQFLYEAVAPTMAISYTAPADAAELWARQEGGQ